MKNTNELKQKILGQLRAGTRIGIMSHVEPDGDGFSASLALQLYLRTLGLESEIVIDDSNLERFAFLTDGSKIRNYTSGQRYDLLIILDCNSYVRLGEREALVRSASHTILIDHHVPENGVIATDFSFVDTSAASVGAIIFRTFQPEIEALPEANRVPICNCLYTTIINDTNNFTNANTDTDVLRISAELCACGINPSQIYKNYFLNHEPLEMRYIGEVLSTIELHSGDRILYMYSTLEMQQRNNLTADAIMNLTRWVQGVRGVAAIAYLREEAPDLYKLSLRSPVLDVNAIAATYGGGGHVSASGAMIQGSLYSIKAELLAKLDKALDANSRHAAN